MVELLSVTAINKYLNMIDFLSVCTPCSEGIIHGQNSVSCVMNYVTGCSAVLHYSVKQVSK
jgi:hypothetical protein